MSAHSGAPLSAARRRPLHAPLLLALLLLPSGGALATTFDQVSSLHIWLTVSSLANKEAQRPKALMFRQIELNWVNAPLEEPGADYLALYLDSEPGSGDALPVSVHKLAGRPSGKILTDYYLPLVDFRANGSSERGLRDECLGYCLGYHSRARLLASSCLRTRPNWMRDSFALIGPRPLSALMLPGTHNSATYARQLDRSALQMINKYQVNQDDNIFSQLLFGVRYLDLRVGYSKVKSSAHKLWIYHDIFRTDVAAEEVFEQVRRFLELSSHEIVILDFHRFTVGFQNESAQRQRERHAKLIELIFAHLGPWLIPSYLGAHAPLHEYVQAGKRVLVGYAGRAQLLAASSDGAQLALYQRQPLDSELNSAAKLAPSGSLDASTWRAAAKQSLDELAEPGEQLAPSERRVGARVYEKLKSLKLIARSFSKRSLDADQQLVARWHNSHNSSWQHAAKLAAPNPEQLAAHAHSADDVSRAALFFGPVRHLWPNKDTLEGLSQYLNESACRSHFGELRALMVELTPTVFGAISDKYDGNRKLAQLANRPVTDWIRERWLHCVNIVASDFFLGNDLIALSVRANRQRVLQRDQQQVADAQEPRARQCKHFSKIEHLIDKSRIPIQFAYQPYRAAQARELDELGLPVMSELGAEPPDHHQLITHYNPLNGAKILLRPLVPSDTHPSALGLQPQSRERRDSFVDSVSDGFADFVSSFKRFFNL